MGILMIPQDYGAFTVRHVYPRSGINHHKRGPAVSLFDAANTRVYIRMQVVAVSRSSSSVAVGLIIVVKH